MVRILLLVATLLGTTLLACGDGATGDDDDADAGPEIDEGIAEVDEATPDVLEEDVADEAEEPEDVADDGADEAEATGARLFSFALMTDLHIGEGVGDYGDPGWDDANGAEDDVTNTLRFAVGNVNFARTEYDIRFVIVTGDLSDSGERSELLKARDILDQLDVPYFPVLGNHDMWPYTGDVEAPGPVGDRVFEEVFAERFAELAVSFPSLTRAPTPSYNPECGCEAHFQNYAFDYEGYHFIALDMVTRDHAPLDYDGVTSEADLFDFEGGTWRWWTDHMAGYDGFGAYNTFIFSHHPPVVTTLGILDCLTLDEVDEINAMLRYGGYGGAVWGFFAGHHHVDYTLEGYQGQNIVVTPAEKDGGTVRVMRLYDDGRVEYGTFL